MKHEIFRKRESKYEKRNNMRDLRVKKAYTRRGEPSKPRGKTLGGKRVTNS